MWDYYGHSETDRLAVRDVAERGYHIVFEPLVDEAPARAYTIGLYKNFHCPEIIAFGFDQALLEGLVYRIAEQIKAGRRFEEGREYYELLPHVVCTFRPVDDLWYEPLLGYAVWYYGHERFKARQVIWSGSGAIADTHGVGAQPRLERDCPVAAGAIDVLRAIGW